MLAIGNGTWQPNCINRNALPEWRLISVGSNQCYHISASSIYCSARKRQVFRKAIVHYGGENFRNFECYSGYVGWVILKGASCSLNNLNWTSIFKSFRRLSKRDFVSLRGGNANLPGLFLWGYSYDSRWIGWSQFGPDSIKVGYFPGFLTTGRMEILINSFSFLL